MDKLTEWKNGVQLFIEILSVESLKGLSKQILRPPNGLV